MRDRMEMVHELVEIRSKMKRLAEEITKEGNFTTVRVILAELNMLADKERALSVELVALYMEDIDEAERKAKEI